MVKSFGSHALSYFALEVWNKLPTIVSHTPSILVFHKHLKSHYFTHLLSLLDLSGTFELVLSNKSMSKMFHNISYILSLLNIFLWLFILLIYLLYYCFKKISVSITFFKILLQLSVYLVANEDDPPPFVAS